MNYAVIMAGGSGTRLWPLSREARPKQILDIFGSKSLLQKSFERLLPIFEPNHIYVQTNHQHLEAVQRELPELPKENIIAEPCMRNTAGAIALAATILSRRDPEAVMAVVTADHIIEPVEEFTGTIKAAIEFVRTNPKTLVTFGITPTYASTQYGYIHIGKRQTPSDKARQVFKVSSFKEKPDNAVAQEYFEAGDYYWNSGMFVWRADKILEEIFVNVPGSAEPLSNIAEAVDTGKLPEVMVEEFVKVPKISIDYAVMEKSQEVYALRMDCKWFDMGSYQALADILNVDNQGNCSNDAQTQLLDCKDNIIVSFNDANHLIAAIGLEDMVVAHTEDATLVCPTSQAGRVKELLGVIEKNKGKEYL